MIPGILASMFVIPKGNVFYGVVVGKSARMVPVEYKDGAWTIQDRIPGNNYIADLSDEGTLVLSPNSGTNSIVNHYQYNGSKFELVGGVTNVQPYTMGNRCISGDGQHMITSTQRSSGMSSLSYILLFSKNASGIFESKGQIGPNNTFGNHKIASDYSGHNILIPRNGQLTTILYKSGNSWLQHDLAGRTDNPNYRMSSVPKNDELRIINHSASQLFLHRFNTTTKTSTFNTYPHFRINTSDLFRAASISRNGEYIATVAQISGIQNSYITIIKIEASSVTHTFLPLMYSVQAFKVDINHDGTVVYVTELQTRNVIVWTRSGTVWTRRDNLVLDAIQIPSQFSDLTAN